MNPLDSYPVLSYAERDRRWAAVSEFTIQRDLAAIVVFGWGRNTHDQYLTNEQQRAVVLMTPGDAPVSMVGRVPLDRHDAVGARYERWVEDIRTGAPGRLLVDLVRERGLSGSRIGVVGLSSRAVGQGPGVIPWSTWDSITSSLPEVTFVDVGADFETMVLVKSDEELAMIRRAGAIGEAACEAFVAAARPGASESAVTGAAIGTIVSLGGWMAAPFVLERAGADRFAWQTPEWMYMGGQPQILRDGDTIGAELFSFYGGFETQQQIDVSIGEPDALLRELEEIAVASYEIGLRELRPGALFSDVCEAMHEPLRAAKVWNTGPLLQTVSPVIFNGATHVDTHLDPALSHLPALPPVVERDGDFVVQAGTAFAFEPNALRGGKRVCVGGTVIVGPDANEELNQICNRLVVVEGS